MDCSETNSCKPVSSRPEPRQPASGLPCLQSPNHTPYGHRHAPRTQASCYPSLNTRLPVALECLQQSLRRSLTLLHPVNSRLPLAALPDPVFCYSRSRFSPLVGKIPNSPHKIPTLWCMSRTSSPPPDCGQAESMNS